MSEAPIDISKNKGFNSIKESAGKGTPDRAADVLLAGEKARGDLAAAEVLKTQGKTQLAKAHEERAKILDALQSELVEDTVKSAKIPDKPPAPLQPPEKLPPKTSLLSRVISALPFKK